MCAVQNEDYSCSSNQMKSHEVSVKSVSCISLLLFSLFDLISRLCLAVPSFLSSRIFHSTFTHSDSFSGFFHVERRFGYSSNVGLVTTYYRNRLKVNVQLRNGFEYS